MIVHTITHTHTHITHTRKKPQRDANMFVGCGVMYKAEKDSKSQNYLQLASLKMKTCSTLHSEGQNVTIHHLDAIN